MTYQVDIIDPKAKKLLQNLADMNLISMKLQKRHDFIKVVNSIRKKAMVNPPSLEEISKEVEFIRAKRYASKKR